MSILSLLGLILVLYVGYLFLTRLGKTFPVIELMLLIAGAQWIIGPLLDYSSEDKHFKYFMHVEEDFYMGITVPCYFVFVIASLIGVSRFKINLKDCKEWLDKNHRIIIGLIVIGYIASFFGGFFFFLLGILKIVGLCMLIFSRIRFKWLIVLAVLGLSAFQALTDAMFHTIILNALFVFFALAIELRLNLFKKISIILASAMVLFFLQTFKLEYREMVWSGKAKDPVGLFVTMMTNSVNSDVEEKDKTAVNSRLNQGWIISVIYDRYKTEEYLGGETVKEAFNSAILPRFLNPSKKGGGGKYTFETLTGLQLLSGTAMGTSLLGEFYGNFGFWGSVFSFIIWGVLLNFVVRKMYDFQKEYVVMILFLPLIFYQIVKAESDMLTVLNHLVKSLIVLASVFFIIKRVEVK